MNTAVRGRKDSGDGCRKFSIGANPALLGGEPDKERRSRLVVCLFPDVRDPRELTRTLTDSPRCSRLDDNDRLDIAAIEQREIGDRRTEDHVEIAVHVDSNQRERDTCLLIGLGCLWLGCNSPTDKIRQFLIWTVLAYDHPTMIVQRRGEPHDVATLLGDRR